MECPICLTTFETDAALIPQLQCNCIFVVHPDCWNKWTQQCLYCRDQTNQVNQPGQIIQVQIIDRYYKVKVFFTVLYIGFMIFNMFSPSITGSKYIAKPIQKCIANMSYLDKQTCSSI